MMAVSSNAPIQPREKKMLSHEECLKKLKELRSLQDVKAELRAQGTMVQEEIDLLQVDLTEYFDVNEMQNIKLEGVGMFYMQRTAFPQMEDPEAVKQWLKVKGDLDHLMSFNSNKFKAYWKELLESGEELPPDTKEFIKTEIRMRRSK